MSIDLEAIEGRVKAATPVVFIDVPMRKENREFLECAKDDTTALLAEVKRQAAEIKTLRSELYPAKEIEERRAESWEAEKRLLQKTREQLSSVTAERDAAVECLRKIHAHTREGGIDGGYPYGAVNMLGYTVNKIVEEWLERSGENDN